MQIDNISISRSVVVPSQYNFVVEIGGCKFDAFFDSHMMSFQTALEEMAKFFAIRAGKLRVRDAGMTRDVEPGGFNQAPLPGEKVR